MNYKVRFTTKSFPTALNSYLQNVIKKVATDFYNNYNQAQRKDDGNELITRIKTVGNDHFAQEKSGWLPTTDINS